MYKKSKEFKTTIEDYNIISNLYISDFESDKDNFAVIDKIINSIEINKALCVDLGTGPGNISDFLLKNKVKTLICVEPAESFFKFLTKKYKKDKNINVIQDDMISFLENSKKNSINLITAGYSIIHINDKLVDNLFLLIKNCLSTNGFFIMSCHKGTYKGFEQDPYQIQNDKRLKTKKKIQTYMNYFTETELKQRLKKAGFSKIHIETFEPIRTTGDINTDKIWVTCQK